MPSTTLTTIPAEILISIAKLLEVKDMAAVALVSRRVNQDVTHVLYKRAVQQDNRPGRAGSVTLTALEHGCIHGFLGTVQHCLDAGASPDTTFFGSVTYGTLDSMENRYRMGWNPNYNPVAQERNLLGLPSSRPPWDKHWPRIMQNPELKELFDREGPSIVHPEEDMWESGHDDREIRAPPGGHPYFCQSDLQNEDRFRIPNNLNPKHLSHWKPLHIAAASGNVALIDLLLKYGADLDSGAEGACRCGRGSSLSTQRYLYDGSFLASWTPLHTALCRSKYNSAEFLVQHGAGKYLAASRPFSPSRQLSSCEIYSPFHMVIGGFDKNEISKLDRIYRLLEETKLLGPDGIDIPDRHGDTALTYACIAGHLTKLGPWFLSHGANVNTQVHRLPPEDETMNLFLFCCSYGRFLDAADLIDMGADTSLRTSQGLSPLHLCCNLMNTAGGRARIPEFISARESAAKNLALKLVNSGADLECKDNTGHTPLLRAASVHSNTMVSTLLSSGANVNAVDPQGATALWLACWKFSKFPVTAVVTVDALLRAGAVVDHRPGNGRTALHEICAQDVDLGTEDNVNYSENVWYDMYMAADCESNAARHSIISLLISRGADINTRSTTTGRSLLLDSFMSQQFATFKHIACHPDAVVSKEDFSGMKKIVLDLKVEQDGDMYPNLRDHVDALFVLQQAEQACTGLDPDWGQFLLRAMREHYWSLVQELMNRGVDANAIDPDTGDNALHFAADPEAWDPPETWTLVYSRAMERMLNAGCEVDALNAKGLAPLHIAVYKGNKAAAEILVKQGADITRPSGIERKGPSPLEIVLCDSDWVWQMDMLPRLLNHVDESTNSLRRQDLSTGPRQSRAGGTALHVLVRSVAQRSMPKELDEMGFYQDDSSRLVKIALALVDCGVPVNAVNKLGRTALVYTLWYLREMLLVWAKSVELSQKTKAAEIQGYEGEIANSEQLDKARWLHYLAAMLMGCGSDLKIADRCGKTAIDYIKDIGRIDGPDDVLQVGYNKLAEAAGITDATDRRDAP